MTSSWHDLYKRGENLNHVLKRLLTEFKKAEADDNSDRILIYGEAIRKCTANIVDIAYKVLGVEELVKGKTVRRNE